MHSEDDLLPISALQHMLFCERQTALIHLERLWVENRFTAEGRVLHKKTDGAKSETRDGVRITRSLPVHSFQLGLFGVCDVVNFKPPVFELQTPTSLPKRIEQELARLTLANGEARIIGLIRASGEASVVPQPASAEAVAATLQSSGGTAEASPLGRINPDSVEHAFHEWTITPVEYKRGQPKKNDADRVQLCAQAMCLEEMLGIFIPKGDLFYGKLQRRTEVFLDDSLRQLTIQTARKLHALMSSGVTPRATREAKCESCSLLPVCMPPKPRSRHAADYLHDLIEEPPI